MFAAGRQWPGLGWPPNRCWFVSGLWLNSWMAVEHTGREEEIRTVRSAAAQTEERRRGREGGKEAYKERATAN